jgi:hypothetical protein
MFRPKRARKPQRTESIGIVFHKEINTNMGAPNATVNTNNGNPLFATVQGVQASGANSDGVVSNLTATLSDTSVATAAVKTSATGVSYIEFTTLKVGTVTATVTATVTDTDGAANTFTAIASITVIPGVNDTVTASINILFSSTVPA